MNRIKLVEKDIKKYKNSLTKKALKSGLYENFGQVEVQKLKDKYYLCDAGISEVNHIIRLIGEFDEWAMNFDLSQLKHNR